METWNSKKTERKISETKVQHHEYEFQALQAALLDPSLSSHDSWSVDHLYGSFNGLTTTSFPKQGSYNSFKNSGVR